MYRYQYEIENSDSITRWNLKPLKAEPFESPMAAFDAPVNMGEAYVQIVYPVREAFLKQVDLEKIKCPEGEFENIYFPFESSRVDFSTFRRTPSVLSVEGRTGITAKEDGVYEFDLYTCGAVRLFLDGESLVTFAPYTRNIAAVKRISLNLAKGDHILSIYADELAERDVFFYFELRNVSGKALSGFVESVVPDEELKSAEAFLESLYFEKGVYETGDLVLKYDGSVLLHPLSVSVSGYSDSGPLDSVWAGEDIFTASKEKNEVVLSAVKDCPAGGYDVTFSVKAGPYTLKRNTLFAINPLNKSKKEAPATLDERKQAALAFIEEYGERLISRAMVIMASRGEMTPEAKEYIDNCLEMIRRKEDCADFVIVPLLWSLMKQRECYGDEYFEEIKKVILDFRYWIDEPGNDVMWYFSENHAFLFHAAEYLAGSLFPEETFTAGGSKGAEQRKKGCERLVSWYDSFNKYHFAEWNSVTYLPIDFIGFFSLYECAPDEEIRKLSKQALDYTFTLISDNTFRGIMSSSYGRCYEKTLKARSQIEPAFLSWIAWGSGAMTDSNRAAALFALSSYAPPEGENLELGENEALTVQSLQGLNQVKTYLYKTSSYSMGSAIRFKRYLHGHQQHVFDVSFGEKCRQFYVNHPGERAFSGENRPSYWAGNGTCPRVVQHKALSLLMFDTDGKEAVHYIHSWSPVYDYDEYAVTDNWFFARVDDSYLAAGFSSPITLTTKGANAYKELISRGLKHAVVVRVSDKKEMKSFDEFVKSILASAFVFDVEKHYVGFDDPSYGLVEADDEETRINGTAEEEFKDCVTREER